MVSTLHHVFSSSVRSKLLADAIDLLLNLYFDLEVLNSR